MNIRFYSLSFSVTKNWSSLLLWTWAVFFINTILSLTNKYIVSNQQLYNKLLILMATDAINLRKMLLNQNTTDSSAKIFVAISTILSSFQFWLLNATSVVNFVYAIQLMKSIHPIFQRETIAMMKIHLIAIVKITGLISLS